MKISLKTVALVLLSAGVGALVAVVLMRDAPTVAVAPDRSEPQPKAQVSEAPGAIERALRRRICRLEAELATARNPPVTNSAARPEVHIVPRQADFRPPSPREMMENFKKNDPKRYAEMQKRFSEMRKRQLERTKGRLDYLGALDTSGMSAEEKANHEKLQDLLVQRENLPEFSENMTEDEMREAGRRRHELDRAIREANTAERSALLRQTALALGLEGEDVTVLTDAIQDVVRATDSDRGGPHGLPPPPGGTR